MTTEQRLYLNSVRAAFPTFSKDEQRFYVYFKSNVLDFIAINKSCTNEELISHFGNAQNIVDEFYENSDIDLNYYSQKSYRNITLLITIIIILMIALSFFYYFYSIGGTIPASNYEIPIIDIYS